MEKKHTVMTRGLSQVLYNYLPGKTFDLNGGYNIGKVDKIISEHVKDIKDTNKLFKLVKRYVDRWDKNRQFGFDDLTRRRDNYIFEKPRNVLYDIFPLVYKCPKCKRVYNYNNYDQILKNNPKLVCLHNKDCNETKLKQVYQVATHSCGHISGLYPLKPSDCKCKDWEKHIKLDDKKSQKISDFRWVCDKCKSETEVKYYCNKCDEHDKLMSVNPHRASKSYFTHLITYVDVPESNYINGWKEDVKKYLGLEEEIGFSDNSFINELLKRKDQMTEELFNDLLKASMPKSNDNFNIDTVDEELGESLHEYLETENRKVLSSVSLEKKYNDLSKTDPLRAIDFKKNIDKYRELGISNILLIEDFPVVTAMFGWSRNDYTPEKCTINSFKYSSDEKGKIPIFIDNGNCEALMFKLDPVTVIKWLDSNKIITELNISEERKARMWLLENMSYVTGLSKLSPDDNPVTYYVYVLLHSLSHIIMKSISVISGFELVGLSEYLFPATLSFVIYSNKTDFSIGGMHTLFETQLNQLRSRFYDYSTCMHDPLCSEQGGACHACVFLPEISCSFFNNNLNRNFVYGTQDFIGYWQNKL